MLKRLVGIDSIYPNEYRIACFLEDYLKKLGFDVEKQYVSKDRFNVIAKRGDKGKPILLYGHMDTVPPFGRWNTDPFTLVEDGDMLIGLGSWDMKAGIAAILKAVEKIDKDINVRVAFCVDEENISEGVFNLLKIKSFFDGVCGIIVTEAGNSDIGLSGPNMLTLGRRGRAVYTIKITGRSAHGATKKGSSAALTAARIIQFLESQELRSHPCLPRASQFVRSINCNVDGLTIPDNAIVELDRHLVPPESFESVLLELRNQLKHFENKDTSIEVSIKQRKTPYMNPYITPREHIFVQRISDMINKKYGKIRYNYALSVADENALATLGIPVVTIGPKGGNDHSANEWVSKSSYLELIDVIEDIIRIEW